MLHWGHRRHSALPIRSGFRRNLIIWLREFPKKRRLPEFAKEESPPDSLCVSFTHDRDFFKYHENAPRREDGAPPDRPWAALAKTESELRDSQAARAFRQQHVLSGSSTVRQTRVHAHDAS